MTRISYKLDGRVWRITLDGHVLGDSRGYLTEAQAKQAAQALVARDPEYRVFEQPHG